MLRQNRTRIYNTVLGFYQYNPDFFDCLNVPTVLNKEYLVNEIITRCGLLEVAYSDMDITMMIIDNWSKCRIPDWERMYQALYSEYNPIHNYDRKSDISVVGDFAEEHHDTDTLTRGISETVNDDNLRTDNLQDTRTGSKTTTYNTSDIRTDNLSETHGGGETTTHENTAYNAGLTATSRDILQRNGDVKNNTGTQENRKTGTDTETYNNLQDSHTGTQRNDRDITRSESQTGTDINTGGKLGSNNQTTTEYNRGNIGVTTTQQLIDQEIELRVKYNIYEIIAKEFKEKFCNLIYTL